MKQFKALWPYIATVIFWLLFIFVVFGFSSCNRELKKENERLREELARQQQYVPLKKDTIHDSVEVVTQKIIEVERIKEVLTDEDRELLKDAGIAAKELLSLQKIGSETKDSVTLEKKDSTEDAPLYYKDAWAEFEYNNRKLRYSVRDSLAIAVKQEYKHRFLWWKWGVKGYEVKAMNFNPHATIRYNTYIKREE